MTVAPVVLADEATRAAILDVEESRQRALLEVDLDTLRDLYDDSLIHTHAPGLTHTKAQLLEHIATRAPYKGATRGELTIRVIGDIAIMTGRLINRLGSPDGSERTVAGAGDPGAAALRGRSLALRELPDDPGRRAGLDPHRRGEGRPRQDRSGGAAVKIARFHTARGRRGWAVSTVTGSPTSPTSSGARRCGRSCPCCPR